MASELKWKGPEAQAEIERLLTSRFNAAVQLVRNEVVTSLNRSQATRRTRGGTLIGLDPSRPGEPPKRLAGRLIQDIQTEVSRSGKRLTGRIFTTLGYSRRLELGFAGIDASGRTISQAPRPFMRPAFERAKPKILRLLGRTK